MPFKKEGRVERGREDGRRRRAGWREGGEKGGKGEGGKRHKDKNEPITIKERIKTSFRHEIGKDGRRQKENDRTR